MERRNIGVYFVDGSDNEDTQNIVKEKKNANLHYCHMPATGPTERTFLILPEINAEYICLGGDTREPVFKELDKVIQLMEKSYSVIQTQGLFYAKAKNYDGTITEYDNPEKLYYEHCGDGITLSTVFLKNRDFSPVLALVDERMMKNIWVPLLLYYIYGKEEKFKGCYYNASVMSDVIPGKTGGSFHLRNSDIFFKIWGEQFEAFASLLPDSFGTDEQKWFPVSSSICHVIPIDCLMGVLQFKRMRLFPEHPQPQHILWLKKLGVSVCHIRIAERLPGRLHRPLVAFLLLFRDPSAFFAIVYRKIKKKVRLWH